MADNIDDAIEENALGPKRVQVGNQSVEQQSIDDLIKADNHLASKRAAANGSPGMRFFALTPKGRG